jgi:hypothetical protein
VDNHQIKYTITHIYFIVHQYTHILHRAGYALRLLYPAFHIPTGENGSGKLLNNSFIIKTRTTGSLFTFRMSGRQNFNSILIPFTETPAGLGCFSTEKKGYTPSAVEKRSTGFRLFHEILTLNSPGNPKGTKKCHFNESAGGFPCFPQFVHNHFSSIFALFSKKPTIIIYVYHSKNKR